MLTRRHFSKGLGLSTLVISTQGYAPLDTFKADQKRGLETVKTLRAGALSLRLKPEPALETSIVGFNRQTTSPVLKIKQGEELAFKVFNDTALPLSLHIYGMRGPNAFDGAAPLTQKPILPQQEQEVRFTPPDAGTFLIRPCFLGQSREAGGRGLCALLVVEDKTPPDIDEDLSLLVQDWLLQDNGELAGFQDNSGKIERLGNHLSINGKALPLIVNVKPNARLRLRLANGCNARLMRLRFENVKPYVVAVDSQPNDTFEPLQSTLPFSPGSRYDLMLDAVSQDGRIMALIGAASVPLVILKTEGEALRQRTNPIAPLAKNEGLPESIRLQNAVRRDLVIESNIALTAEGKPSLEAQQHVQWTFNKMAGDVQNKPLFSVKRGTPIVLGVTNKTPFQQAVHVHGHSCRLLHVLDDGWEPYWLDVAQIPENKTIQMAFVADNPGKWIFGSSILERLDAGLWTWFEVL